ncbi:MAG: HDOD domain-containing protein [Desulfobacula sp.]|nr:HDOD domain-containing protein [Desulfobacula sp.]
MTKKNIFEIIKRSNNLPQLPQVMVKLIRACNSDQTNIEELTQIISIDPGLTSKLIQIIGSPFINLPKEVNNIKTAVVYLGMDTIRNIAISTSAMHFFKNTKSVPEFNINKFWYHSYKCGVFARKMAEEENLTNPDEFFLAGLLHDIGRLVLLENFPDEYQQILSSCSTENEILAAELEEFDADTAQISAWIFKQWDLNPLLADSVLFINESVEQIESALSHVKIIFISNLLAHQDTLDKISDIISLTDIPESSLEQIATQSEEEVQTMAKSLGINMDDTQDTDSEEQLSSQIKDLSLFYGTLQNLLHAKDIDSIFNIVQNGFKIIFNIPRIFYFMLDEKKNILAGLSHKHDKSHNIIKNIALPVSSRTSLIVRCIKGQKVLCSLNRETDQKSAISDTQIIRLLETKGLYCIPICSSDTTIGVMVLGVDETMVKTLEDNQELVKLFSKQTSVCIQNIRYYSDYASNIHEKKMQAYSTLTDKIIHEINNPIAIIKNYIETLGLKLPDKHPAQEELVVINEEMTRVAGLLSRLRSFSNPVIEGFELVDINKLCKNIFEILQKSMLLPRQIEASINLDPKIPKIKTDQNGIKQIFINLVKNAAEALDSDNAKDGKITVSTRFVSNSAKILIDEKKRIPGNIEIEIADNGTGIDEKLKETLFEPYTSTKDQISNSGLGLSIVHSIVKELNGKIACRTKPGTGTSFIITLPVNSSKKH